MRPPLRRYAHEAVLALALLTLFAYAGVVDHRFVTLATQQGLIGDMWEIATVSVPMTLIIITGGIDLSVGSAMALSSVVFGLAFAAHWGVAAAAAAVEKNHDGTKLKDLDDVLPKMGNGPRYDPTK